VPKRRTGKHRNYKRKCAIERQGNETHITTEEARGGRSNHVVRWVLGISLLLAIVALTIIWVTGAVMTPG
jgi:hypothetical protein